MRVVDKILTYQAVLTPEDGGWVVSVPDIRGCHTEGDTVEEARAMAEEAITGILGVLADQGRPIPKPSTTVALKPGEQAISVTVHVPKPEGQTRSA
ncbi:MAG TPA: type II toxin-antitoxin system HicB family antitoxin [Fimbriimonadaceae bacterium]|jgi:predicted RNase H-like HicB family nuclease